MIYYFLEVISLLEKIGPNILNPSILYQAFWYSNLLPRSQPDPPAISKATVPMNVIFRKVLETYLKVLEM